MSIPVAAVIPLSLLEAIRNLDTPVEDGLDERSPELVAKRLGLSSTVAAHPDFTANPTAARDRPTRTFIRGPS